MAEKTPLEKVEDKLKEDVAGITSHSKSDLEAYENVAPEYMNYSSVARKPFEGEGEGKPSATEADKKAGQAEAPKAPAAPQK